MFLYTLEFCLLRGSRYELNKTYPTLDCSKKCTCNSDLKFTCEPLCPQTILCKQDETVVYKRTQMGTSKCSCNIPFCKKRGEQIEWELWPWYLRRVLYHKPRYIANSAPVKLFWPHPPGISGISLFWGFPRSFYFLPCPALINHFNPFIFQCLAPFSLHFPVPRPFLSHTFFLWPRGCPGGGGSEQYDRRII